MGFPTRIETKMRSSAVLTVETNIMELGEHDSLAEVPTASGWSMASFESTGSVKARLTCITGHEGNAGNSV